MSRAVVLAGFAAIYVVWGSTYLGIRFAIETLPPLVMTGARFLLAGGLMYGWARARGVPGPSPAQWGPAALVGICMMLFGVGGTSWAEQRLSSGVAALIVAVGPFWMVLVDWLWFDAERPDVKVMAGLVLGFSGIFMLVGPEQVGGVGRVDLLGVGVILFGTITWAFGSLYSRNANLPSSSVMAVGMEMLAGGVVLIAAGTAVGEWQGFEVAQVSVRSLLALLYLALFGSIVALSSYLWLLKAVSPARVATHAYVNPIVAVFLGWWLGGEAVGLRTLAAAAVIVLGVLVIVSGREARRVPAAEFEHS